MARIIVAGPSQRIHRFLLPPHSRHVMSHNFPGGGVVLASILHRLACAEEALCKTALEKWNEALLKWENSQASAPLPQELPNRFIRLEPFAAVPALKKHLKPDTKFLRVNEKEDGDHFYKHVQAAFCIESAEIKRNVILVGGENPADTWKEAAAAVKADGGRIENLEATDGDVVFILAKSSAELVAHAHHALTKIYDGRPVTLIGHIDVSKLAEAYPLQTDTSYERTVGDICRAIMPAEKSGSSGAKERPTMLEELLQGKELQVETRLDHLIIRIGNAACLVASPREKALRLETNSNGLEAGAVDPAREENGKAPFVLRLFCHPDRCAPTNFPGLGSMLAYDMLLCAAVVRQMSRVNVKDDLLEADFKPDDSVVEKMPKCYAQILEGARIGVQATYRCFVEGFGIFDSDEEEAKRVLVNLPADEFFAKFVRHGIAAQKLGTGGSLSTLHYKIEDRKPAPKSAAGEPPAKGILHFKVHYDTARSPNKFWRMVVPGEKGGTDEGHCLEVARKHLENPKALPLVDLGKNKLVDRQEVEDYLYLQRLLQNYHQDAKWRRPLCIGVFGQPGSGKSFGVKQLVSEMSGSSEAFSKDSIEVNLSQLRTLKELADCFHLVRDACLKPPIPLVFFDEFDSSFEDRTFGWLKYFLAPMQDGEFFSEGKNYHFGKAIFVFAGGVNHSFAEFNERSRNPAFCNAKGPDFISRLRGILNICSMNKPEGEKGTVEHIYKIRRAVFLQYLLEEKLGRLSKQDKDAGKKLIADTLAEAFLTIPRYKHGARSLEAILNMSNLVRGECFTHSSLPPRDQLDMHVDAREFLRLAGVLTTLSKI